MKEYLELAGHTLEEGERRTNRTGVPTTQVFSASLTYDLQERFPVPSTKALNTDAVFAELVGFIRGVTSAADFRQLGTKIWDKNANENDGWLHNAHRKGDDDLGPIYGAQWRRWESIKMVDSAHGDSRARIAAYLKDNYEVVGQCEFPKFTRFFLRKEIDQLRNLIDGLRSDPYDRAHLVSAWNPGVQNEIALRPCHVMFQCNVRKDAETGVSYLDMLMFQRSADMFLGVPFNIASYAALTHLLCALTGYQPGRLTIQFGDLHVYDTHVKAMNEQLSRTPDSGRPTLYVRQISDIDHVTVEHFELQGYDPQPAIGGAPMAV